MDTIGYRWRERAVRDSGPCARSRIAAHDHIRRRIASNGLDDGGIASRAGQILQKD